MNMSQTMTKSILKRPGPH